MHLLKGATAFGLFLAEIGDMMSIAEVNMYLSKQELLD